MEYIGFTTTYYTLWEVTNDGKYCHYRYKQNLSKDFDKAKAKAPHAFIDLTLRGHSSFKVLIPTFLFGKYKGQQINECNDFDYMKWYHNISKVDDVKKVIRPILIENGYKLWNGKLLCTEKEYEYQNMLAEKFPIFEKKINNGESFKFYNSKYPKSFVNENGMKQKELNIPFCKLIFKENAFIPSNKTLITITDYSAILIDDMTFEIIVNDFHIG